MVLRRTIFFKISTVQSIYSSKTQPLHFITLMCFCKALDIEFVAGSSAGSLRPHSDTVKKIPGLRPGHVYTNLFELISPSDAKVALIVAAPLSAPLF